MNDHIAKLMTYIFWGKETYESGWIDPEYRTKTEEQLKGEESDRLNMERQRNELFYLLGKKRGK